jgi:hypothetical protein
MALSLEQQNALDSLPPPDSLERIVRFLSDLGTQGNAPLGETGRAAQGFAASLGGSRSFSARQTSGWVAILMDRYQIKMVEIQDFALWFVRRQEIFAKTVGMVERVPDLAERAPEPVLARLPALEPTSARLPAPAVRVAAGGVAVLTLAVPAAGAAVPVGPGGLPLSFESAAAAAPAPPRTTLRRQQVLPPPEADEPVTASVTAEETPVEPPASRRRTGRVSSDAPRLRRIERMSAAPEPEALAEPEPLTEEPPPAKRPFRLTPQMVTRPAFVTNIGLAGLLTGMSLAPVQADTMLASPAMTLATPSPLNIGPAPLNIGPTWSALPGQSPESSLRATAFTPTITPMMAPSLPVSPVQLGMPSPPPVPSLPFVDGSRVSPVSAALKAPSATLLSPAPPLTVNSPVGSVFSKAIPATGLPPLTALPSVDLPPNAPKLPTAAQAVPGLLGMAAASAGLATAADLIDRPALGTSPASGQSAIGQSLPAQASASPDAAHDASSSVALTPLPLFTGQANRWLTGAVVPGSTSRREGPTTATPEMGQITLVAPPLQVASAQAERSGVAASVDWKTLAGGAGPLDEGSLARLKPALPNNAALLYPALTPGRLGTGAVNLPLSAPLVQSLLQKSYGQAAPGLATRAADLGRAASGGAPAAMPLPAQIVPGKRPIGSSAGMLGHVDEEKGGAGALTEAGQGQAKRGGVLDFLGLPVRLAPSLGGGAELARETAVRSAGSGPVRSQHTLRPEQFAPLRNRLFPAFHSMAVEPDKAAWRQAAPSFGLRDGKPTTILAPDARVAVQTPTSPLPASGSQPPPSSRPFSLRPMLLPGGFGNIASGSSQAPPRSGGGFGNIGHVISSASPAHSSASPAHSGGSHTRGSWGLPALSLGSLGGSIGSVLPQGHLHSSGRFHSLGGIAPSLSSAHSSGGGLGNLSSVLSQASDRSSGPFPNLGGVAPTFGHPLHRHLPLRHPAFGSAGFSSSGSHALPSVNLAAPRTVSYGLSPSQIVRPRGFVGSATPIRTTPAHPTGSRVVNFGSALSSVGSMPTMRFVTPRPANRAASESAPPMTIQRSETTTKATPTRNEGARPQTRAVVAPAGGAAGSEVSALAGEVWSLLKRRLAMEAERSGRR